MLQFLKLTNRKKGRAVNHRQVYARLQSTHVLGSWDVHTGRAMPGQPASGPTHAVSGVCEKVAQDEERPAVA